MGSSESRGPSTGNTHERAAGKPAPCTLTPGHAARWAGGARAHSAEGSQGPVLALDSLAGTAQGRVLGQLPGKASGPPLQSFVLDISSPRAPKNTREERGPGEMWGRPSGAERSVVLLV